MGGGSVYGVSRPLPVRRTASPVFRPVYKRPTAQNTPNRILSYMVRKEVPRAVLGWAEILLLHCHRLLARLQEQQR
jgi:hypothetical protein